MCVCCVRGEEHEVFFSAHTSNLTDNSSRSPDAPLARRVTAARTEPPAGVEQSRLIEPMERSIELATD